MIQKYQFMQSNVEARIRGLKEKIPEMRGSLEAVKFLMGRGKKGEEEDEDDERDNEDEDEDEDENDDDGGRADGAGGKSIETTFQLNPTLYAHASIPLPSSSTGTSESEIYLWLGANIMVSYPLPDAESLLSDKLTKARESLRTSEEDVEFLREQITGLEVATARVWNWDVGEKRRLRGQGKAIDAGEGDER